MVPLESPAPAPEVAASSVLRELELFDTLGSAHRLWVRGRVVLETPPPPPGKRSWWKPWRTAPAEAATLPTAVIQTEVSGTTLAAEVILEPDGGFEASFEADLPPARRGWRVARHQVTFAGQSKRACSVVLTPPAHATAGLAVVLPLAFTHEPEGAQRFTHSPSAARMGDLLRRLHAEQTEPCPVYYLSTVPPEARNLQPELALAATALGWPNGHFVLLPATRDDAGAVLAAGLERLRWLLADALDLVVLNQEPDAEAALADVVLPQPDRATVTRFVRVAGDAEAHAPAAIRPALWESRPARADCVPRHPVVFCHGMLAMTLLRMQIPEDTNYFTHLRPFFRERGVCALYPGVEPTGGVLARAEQLRDQIRAWTDEPVNIIAHSMGGLDARHLITHLGMGDRVRSLTTIATPHRGTAVADWFCENFRQRVPLLFTLQAFGINVDGFRDCRTDACRIFSENTPDVPGVRYFSYGGAVPCSRVSPLLRRAWNVLTPLEGPNDGLVSLRSARWGEYLGSLSVDHFGQTPDGLFVHPGESFDALGFYWRLVEDLARRGL